MKRFFGFLLFACSLFGNSTHMEIDEHFSSKSALLSMTYLESNSTDITTIISENSKIFTPVSKQNLGYFGKSYIWTKLEIKNTSDTTINLIAFNPRAGMDIVDMYLLKDGKIVAIHKMGDQQLFQNRTLKGRHSSIDFSLQPHESVQLWTMLKNKGTVFAEIVLSERNVFFQKESYELMAIAMFSTVLMILVIYLMFLAKVLNQKLFLMYTGHLFCMVLYYGSINGTIYYVSQGELALLQEFMNYFGITIGLACLWYFDLIFFHLNRIAPKIYKVALAFATLFTFLTLTNFLQQYHPIFTTISKLLPLMGLVIYLYSIAMLVYILSKKLPYAPYYFVGHFVYHSTLLIYVEVIMGKIPETFLTLHVGSMGIIFEGIIITYVMKQMIQKSLLEHQNMEELLMAHSHFLSTGREMAIIIHQWKIPLHRISSIVTYLESLVFKKDIPIKVLNQSLNQMRQSITFMDDTISSFYDFYRKEEETKTFDLSEYIDKLIDMFRPLLESHQIEIHNECPKEFMINSKAHILGHVFLILIQNSIESLSQLERPVRRIAIQCRTIKEHTILTLNDNGKGIEPNKIKQIFLKSIESKKGLGFGLYLAHFLVTKELNGKITAENLPQGVCFKIFI
ncbi:MAG: hypothetical protein KU29_02300 [Sulfurovum sp. FS06-10]|nr:MAG: hypothetical protein KU29_02300 [Sulfurovum sp. FS06-10]